MLQNIRAEKATAAVLFIAVVCYVSLAVGSSITKSPWSDEGWFANAALNLARTGRMSTTVLETTGTNLKGLDQHTYWVMPLHLVTQAGWYKAFGFGLLSMRVISILFGLLALGSWFVTVRILSNSVKVAVLTFALLATDYLFIMAASFGRMDMMSTAFGSAGLASYLWLRERDLRWAVLLSHSLIVACGLTHPNGGVIFFAGLFFLVLYFDWASLRFQHLLIAATPYILGGIAWGLYILQAPSFFMSQFVANASMGGRMGGITSPLKALKDEFALRYLVTFGLGSHSPGHTGPIALKAFVPLTYLIAFICILSNRNLRKHKGVRALLILTVLSFLILTLFEGQKMSFYLLHLIPLYTSLVAIFGVWVWKNTRIPKFILVGCLLGFAGLQISTVLYRMSFNPYQKKYNPATAFLSERRSKDTQIMGSAILGFNLGFENLVDDVRLGYYSGKKPDLIVIEDLYTSAFEIYKTQEPQIYSFIQQRLRDEYTLIYDGAGYRVYSRNPNLKS